MTPSDEVPEEEGRFFPTRRGDSEVDRPATGGSFGTGDMVRALSDTVPPGGGASDGGDSPWQRRYQQLQEVGRGGMGAVFRAQDSVLKRTVALKFIRGKLMDGPALARFFLEAQAVAQLAHPNIVTLYGIHPGDREDEPPFLEMEWIDGTDLNALVAARGPLDVWQAREYIRMAALGLQHAHEKGLVHRDIKPSNLMLTAAGSVVKVLDFGLARLLRTPGEAAATGERRFGTSAGQGVGSNPFVQPGQVHDREGDLMGTLAYIAPEQCLSPNVDIRADIYSLGCTFYHLLAGVPPFTGAVDELIDAHLNQEPVPVETCRPDIPRGLATIIKRMMAKKPEDRYQTPAELILALDRLLQPAAPPPPGKVSTVDELVATLRRYLLLEDRQLDDLELGLAPKFSDVNALLAELRSRDWLTDYQCGELLAGNGKQLALGGSYVLLRPLGEGGVGRVFLARPRLQGRHVAIKIIKPEMASEAEFADRFRREMMLTSQLSHPNVVLMLTAEDSDGRLFLVMEYLDGKDLDRIIKDRAQGKQPVTRDEARDWMTQAANGLAHIHAKNMVHRDIKPANLFVTAPDGRVKLLDLGLARLVQDTTSTKISRSGSVLGTVDYMAPEQAYDARKVDIRADLYGLGCAFYHALAGQVPFPASNIFAVLMRHQADTAAPLESLRPDLPAGLAATVRKLMAKKPEDRFQTPAELLAALAALPANL